MNDPAKTQSPRSRWGGTTTLCGAAIAATVVLYLVNPAGVAWLPKCPLYLISGWHCPGCGTTRAAHALLHGDLAGAFTNNMLVVGLSPLLVASWIWQRYHHGATWASRISPRSILFLMIVVIAFAVLRNLPVYPFTFLAPH